MNNNEKIQLFFSSDENYLPFLAVSIKSLIENASTKYNYVINILHSNLSKDTMTNIEDMANSNFEINFVDVSQNMIAINEKLNLRDYYTPSIYYRIFIASLFPTCKKAIYMDCDITVVGDISDLYNIDLGDNILGACVDDIISGHKIFRKYAIDGLGISHEKYFNSGVLLMNLELYRQLDVEGTFVHLLNTYNFDTICPDQDYLNIICKNKVLYLDKSWDKMSIKDDYDGELNLIHYNMFKKPWLYDDVPYQQYFWKYAKETKYYDQIMSIKNAFTSKGKKIHKKGNKELLAHALRIANAELNFNTVLNKSSILHFEQSQQNEESIIDEDQTIFDKITNQII